MSMSIFALDDQLASLLTDLDRIDESSDPESADKTRAMIALVDQMLMEKTEGYCSIIRELELTAEKRQDVANAIAARAKSARTTADWLRNRLLVHMQSTGQQRIETIAHTISIRTNPPAVTVVDASAVPHEYNREKITIDTDRRAILEYFKTTGEVVPGVEITRGQRLDIR
jgi:hypothetical protein